MPGSIGIDFELAADDPEAKGLAALGQDGLQFCVGPIFGEEEGMGVG